MNELAPAVRALLPVAGTIVVATVGVSLAYQFGKWEANKSSRSASSRREKLYRNSDYVEIVAESEDGYGTAVRDSDGGVEVLSFNHDDEVYQDTWIPGRDLDALADAISVRACEKERDLGE